jgi:hypothetical protein
MPLCRCPHCLEEVSGGKSVSKSTFHRHAKKFSRLNIPFSKICHCSQHPTGRRFRSRNAYYQHRQSSRGGNISDTLDYDLRRNYSSTSSPPFSAFDSDDHRDNISQLIENDLLHLDSDDGDDDDGNIIHSAWNDFDFSSSNQSLNIGMSGML